MDTKELDTQIATLKASLEAKEVEANTHYLALANLQIEINTLKSRCDKLCKAKDLLDSIGEN